MYSKNFKPTAKQKQWHQWLRDNTYHCDNCGAPASELHHIIGAGGKHNKIHIGQWACVMLCHECNHDDSRLPTKREQLDRFTRGVLQSYWRQFGVLPMDQDELMAIACWQR